MEDIASINHIATLQALTTSLSAAETPEQVVESVLTQGIPALGAAAGCVVLLDESGSELILAGMSGCDCALPGATGRLPLFADAPLAEAAREQRPIWKAATEYLPRFPVLTAVSLLTQDVWSAALPLVVHGRCLGALGLSFPSERVFSEADRLLALSLAQQCALALAHARLFHERQAQRQAEQSRLKAARVLERITDGFVALDHELRFTYANPEAERLIGLSRQELLGREIWDVIPPGAESDLKRQLLPLRDTGSVSRMVAVGRRSFEIRLFPAADGLSVYFRDVTEQRKREEWLRFLVEAGSLLNASLDLPAILRSLVELAVPRIADWAVVYLLDGGETLRCAEACCIDEQQQILAALHARMPDFAIQDSWLGRVAQAGKPFLLHEVDDRRLERIAQDAAQLELLRSINVQSALVIPMTAREQVIGALVLVITASGRRFVQSDLPLAEELACRAALAVDNARLYKEAQDAISSRDLFLSVAAHELKTPITSLSGFAQLLVRQFYEGQSLDTERSRQSLLTIERQSLKLASLVNKLLDVARIKAGRLSLSKEQFDLAHLAQSAVQHARSRSAIHTITLTLHMDAVIIHADPLRIEQVLTNLLDNAIKYSPAGGQLKVELGVVDNVAMLKVIDYGIGIPPERRDRMFDPFYQAHPDAHSAGMGLGLFISRQIALLHGGSLSAEFPVEGGSCFVLCLPTAAAF